MLSFFKKKASAAEIGEYLLEYIRMDSSCLLEKLPEDKELKSVAELELIFLLAFAVDYTTSRTLGNTPEKKAILENYYSILQNTLDSIAYKKLVEHLDIYTIAVNTPNQNGPAWTVGVAFCELCGCLLDIQLTTMGMILFGETFEQISKFLKSYKITKIDEKPMNFGNIQTNTSKRIVSCQKCGQKLRVPAGKIITVKCPCGHNFKKVTV